MIDNVESMEDMVLGIEMSWKKHRIIVNENF